jgi:hypothetical protein
MAFDFHECDNLEKIYPERKTGIHQSLFEKATKTPREARLPAGQGTRPAGNGQEFNPL